MLLFFLFNGSAIILKNVTDNLVFITTIVILCTKRQAKYGRTLHEPTVEKRSYVDELLTVIEVKTNWLN